MSAIWVVYKDQRTVTYYVGSEAETAVKEDKALEQDAMDQVVQFVVEEHRNCSPEEEKLEVAGQVLCVLAHDRLAFLATFLGTMLGMRGPTKATSLKDRTSSGGKAFRMSLKGQAVIRSAATYESSILYLLEKTTGMKVGVKSVIGLAAQVLVAAGLDAHGHSLSMLPRRELKQSIAAKLLTTIRLVVQAHTDSDLEKMKTLMSSSLNVNLSATAKNTSSASV